MSKELTAWQKVLLARDPNRPHCRDYLEGLITDFIELYGDRCYGDDPALVGGIGRFHKRTVVILGHQKGRETADNIKVNFGMAHPEGYKKAGRLMKLGEKFHLPVITLVDTPGAHPGLEAEEHNQAAAIAENLKLMARLQTPTISVIIGEGGSGGALGIALADRVLMLENSIYSVISPEGCAAILWKTQDAKEAAAQTLKLTAPDLLSFKIIHRILPEPVGGAHKNPGNTIEKVGQALESELESLCGQPLPELLEARYHNYRRIGVWEEELLSAENGS